MADNFIKVQIVGAEKLQAALSRFPREIAQRLGQAGEEAAARVIFPTRGIKEYPPAVAHPPYPWVSEKQRRYVMAAIQRGEIEVPYRRGQSPGSEKYLDQWYAKREGYATAIGNRSSYAPYLAGQQQSGYMAGLGWRRLIDVVTEKLSDITKVYESFVAKLLKDLNL